MPTRRAVRRRVVVASADVALAEVVAARAGVVRAGVVRAGVVRAGVALVAVALAFGVVRLGVGGMAGRLIGGNHDPSRVRGPGDLDRGRLAAKTGRLHLGNYLGAIRPMLDAQETIDSVVMIADLHALTVEHDPRRLPERTAESLATILATGLDPTMTLCYVQSDVPEHAELHYLLECATGYGEAARMIQFRQRSTGPGQVRLSLLTYPVLMAADVLLHDAEEVPVGEDQSQHLELARDVANRAGKCPER